jgi:N-dimethylarginine dimethylaminohydrolase
VLLGRADHSGSNPTLEEAYDLKSRHHIEKGTYPREEDLMDQLEGMQQALEKHDVLVLRPDLIEGCNQIFARDIGFVIDDFFFLSNILPARAHELNAINEIIGQIPSEKIISCPSEVHVEGGDVIVYNDYVFVGYYDQEDYPEMITARTNRNAVSFLKDFFPNKKVIGLELIKSKTDAFKNVLHLDCCFQPVGHDKAIVYPQGFVDKSIYDWLQGFFGQNNLFVLDDKGLYEMHANVLSIRPDLVISDPSFIGLNQWLISNGIQVVPVDYHHVSKQGGLFRCTTLPLIRKP